MAFDLMYAGGELLLELPLRERRNRLEAVVEALVERVVSPVVVDERARESQSVLFAGEESAGVERLMISPSRLVESAEDIDRAYADARARANEGVMLKAAESVVSAGAARPRVGEAEARAGDAGCGGDGRGVWAWQARWNPERLHVRGAWRRRRAAECGQGLLGTDRYGDRRDERVDDGAYAGRPGILSHGRAADGAGGSLQQHHAQWASCERICDAVPANLADQNGQAGRARSIRWSGWKRSISRRWISRWRLSAQSSARFMHWQRIRRRS